MTFVVVFFSAKNGKTGLFYWIGVGLITQRPGFEIIKPNYQTYQKSFKWYVKTFSIEMLLEAHDDNVNEKSYHML